MTHQERTAAAAPVETRISYQVTRADGTVEAPVVGEWVPTEPHPTPALESAISPRTFVRWIQQKLTKKVN